MNSFMSWVGGKKALRDEIVSRLCHSCDRYVEVFGGGGWVLFHKTPGKFEVYNDFNPNLANLYRCVRDHPNELCEELRYSLNSRTDFEHIREVLKSKTAIPDIKRAAYFYQIIRQSYASGLDSYMYLFHRANKDGQCWPSEKRIAKDLSMSLSTVKRALQDLRGHGYLITEQRYRSNGGNSTLNYSIKNYVRYTKG